ncbi:hypothetical protein WUBG_13341, partial [Wuchereria bancrofti]
GMAGGGSSKELRVPKVNGTTALDGLKEVNRPVRFKLPHSNNNEETETSEDDEIA